MAANSYAVDFSGLGTEVQAFKGRRRKKLVQRQVDDLIKKRDGMDEDLSGQMSKQRQLMDDTPEQDQTYNTQELAGIKDKRLQAKANRYNELGGLSSEDFKGMTTDAVDAFKSRVSVERVAAKDREDRMTADALVTYEAMGKDPKYLKDWFNETQAHKWGLDEGVDRFEQSGNSILVYENGVDYGKEGNVPTSIPKDQFNMFASSSLNPESTKLMAKSLQEGNIPIIVKANQLKESMKYYDTLEDARVAMGMSDADFKKMMGIDTAKEILKEYINVEKDGVVTGMALGTDVEGKEFRRKGPKKVEKKTGSGSTDPFKLEKVLLQLADAEDKGASKGRDNILKALGSEYGIEYTMGEDGGVIIDFSNVRAAIKKEYEKAVETSKKSPSPEALEKRISLEEDLRAINNISKHSKRATDRANLLRGEAVSGVQRKSGLDLQKESKTVPVAASLGRTADETAKAAALSVKGGRQETLPPPEQGMAVPRNTKAGKVTELSAEAKQKRIQELRAKLKNR